jgi:putative PEP-CTERM system TPR-repeat lipoprotein
MNVTVTLNMTRTSGFLLAVSLACVLSLAGCSKDSPQALVASGKAYAAKREHKSAIIQFKAALQADGQLAEARLLLGKSLLESGDAAAAVVELSKSLEQRQPPEQVLPLLAKALIDAGEPRKLITQYDSTTLSDPKGMAALKTALAQAWQTLGNTPKATAARDAALTAQADYGPALVLAARDQAFSGQIEPALAVVTAVLQREPGLADAWQLKGQILITAKGDKTGAEQAFRKALEADPLFLAAHGSLVSLALSNNDLPAAKSQIEAMRKLLPPTSGQLLFVEGLLAARQDDLKRARDLSSALVNTFPDNLGVLQLAGVVEARSGSLLGAETLLAKALRIDPSQDQARRNLAQVYLLLGTPGKALETLKPMLGSGSRDSLALALAAEALQQAGDMRGAETYYARAASISPDDESVQTAATLARLSRGDTAAAVVELTKLSKRSKGVYADMALISAHLQRMDTDAALQAIDAMAKKDPDNTSAPSLRGQVHMLRNDMPAARQAYEAALKINPRLYAAIANLAVIDEREKKPADAQKRFEAVLAADPRNHLASMALAELRLRQGAPFPEAAKILRDAIKASPQEAGPRLLLVNQLLQRKQFTEALAAARDAAAAIPGSPAVLDAVGVAQTLSGDMQQALSTFKQAANLDPGAAQPHVRMADLFSNRGDTRSAQNALKRALESDPGLESVHVALVNLALREKRPKDALDVAKDLQTRYPQKAYGHLIEGLLAQRQKDNAAAAAAFRAGLKTDPTSTSAAVRLYQTLMASGQQAEARKFAVERLKTFPLDAVFEYQVAEEAMARGDFAETERLLRAMVDRHPRQVLVLNNLAGVLLAQDKPGALPYAERAVAEQRSNPMILDTLAAALAAEKQFPRAIEVQKEAVALAPEDDTLRLNLAKLALRADDKALARVELDKLSARGRLFPQQDEVARLKKSL